MGSIFIVDDEPGIRTLARITLRGLADTDVICCASGEELLDRATDNPPALVVIDVSMPGMDGPSAVERLRTVPGCAGVPVIFLTAAAEALDPERRAVLGVADVVKKPFDPDTLRSTVTLHLTTGGSAGTARDHDTGAPPPEELSALQDEFARSLPERVEEIRRIWAAKDIPDYLDALRNRAHGLKGAALSFGFSAVGKTASELEDIFTRAGRKTGTLDPAAVEHIEKALRDLAARAARPEPDTPIRTLTPTGRVPEEPPAAPDREPVVLVPGEGDPDFDEIARQLPWYGYRVIRERLSTGNAPDPTGEESGPSALVTDTATLGNDRTGRRDETPLAPLGTGRRVPVVAVSASDGFADRLRAVRAGAAAFFTRPVDIGALVDALEGLTTPPSRDPFRVLVVDDDRDLARLTAGILAEAGMETSWITEPLRIMETLASFRPELLLSDVYMPDCTGVELARVIRQNPAFVDLPIVFLSSESDIERQLRAMQTGADEFLVKPIAPDHLVQAVRTRAARYRILRGFLIRDGLTGLLNHTRTKEVLDGELSRAARQKTPVAFAMIDVDHFKSVNDTYGHQTGDRVLKGLARILRQRLRRSDTVGRYGGEEFAVIIPGVDALRGAEIIDGIRADMGDLRFRADTGEFSVTFSAGVAHFPAQQTPAALTEAADQALYEAKRGGRNQVRTAPITR